MSIFSDLETKVTNLVTSVTPADAQVPVHSGLTDLGTALNGLLVALENAAEEDLHASITARLGPMAGDLEHAFLESFIKKAQERQAVLLGGNGAPATPAAS